MNGIVNRALVASAAVGVVAACSSVALANDDVYGSSSTGAGRGTPPHVIVGAPARDVVTYEEKGPNSAMLSSGAVMLGLSYGTSVLVAATSDRRADENLFIPVAGPWMDLADRGPSRDVNETVNKVMIVADGVFQGIGMMQILGSFIFPETRTVTRTAKPGVHFTPTGGLGSVGISAYGTF